MLHQLLLLLLQYLMLVLLVVSHHKLLLASLLLPEQDLLMGSVGCWRLRMLLLSILLDHVGDKQMVEATLV